MIIGKTEQKILNFLLNDNGYSSESRIRYGTNLNYASYGVLDKLIKKGYIKKVMALQSITENKSKCIYAYALTKKGESYISTIKNNKEKLKFLRDSCDVFRAYDPHYFGYFYDNLDLMHNYWLRKTFSTNADINGKKLIFTHSDMSFFEDYEREKQKKAFESTQKWFELTKKNVHQAKDNADGTIVHFDEGIIAGKKAFKRYCTYPSGNSYESYFIILEE